MTSPLNIRITPAARARLKEIYSYSLGKWGKDVAGKYLMDIEAVIQQAALDHGGIRRNAAFSRRFTYSPARQHYVFFDVRENTLYVVTVFHAAMDIKARMEEEIEKLLPEAP